MIEWEPALAPERMQSRLIRQVLRAWDRRPAEWRNVPLRARWTFVGSAQTLVKLEPAP